MLIIKCHFITNKNILMKTILSRLILFTLLIFVQSNYSQTVNLGDLYISAGTIFSTTASMDNKSTGHLVNDGNFYLYNHYSNDGIVTFNTASKSGVTFLVGVSGFQNISGSAPMEWYNAEFSNNAKQPAFYLTNEVQIFGTCNFQSGIIENASYSGQLIFAEEAKALNASNASFVNGYVQKKGIDDFNFPIGSQGYYRYAGISSVQDVSCIFKSRYFFENSDLYYPHQNKQQEISIIDDQEYWVLDRGEDEDTALVTLTWDEQTTPAAIYSAPLDELHIVRWDESKKLWLDEGGIANPDKKEITTVIQMSDFGIFTLARSKIKDKNPCGEAMVVYNAVSPNGDANNDYFKIEGLIDCAAENSIEIYNRWGVKVYETDNYGSNNNFFTGYSEGRTTIAQKELLPAGTYFYILYFKNENSEKIKDKAGYLYLSR